MNEAWSALVGALLGALAVIGGAWFSASRQEKAENRKWSKEQKRKAYSDALKSLSAATIIPVELNPEEIEKWFYKLVDVRESLIVLQAFVTQGRGRLAKCTIELLSIIDGNNFSEIATEAATIRETQGNSPVAILSFRDRQSLHHLASEVLHQSFLNPKGTS